MDLLHLAIGRHRLRHGADAPMPEVLIADKGYDADHLVELLDGAGIEVVIPSRVNRKVQRQIDRERYKNRNRVERFFNRLKNARRVATRYEKTARNFISVVMIAACFT